MTDATVIDPPEPSRAPHDPSRAPERSGSSIGLGDELRVLRGIPTAEELAAIIGVLVVGAARLRHGSHAGPASAAPSNQWSLMSRPGFAHRDGRPTRTGAHAWRTSALPRSS